MKVPTRHLLTALVGLAIGIVVVVVIQAVATTAMKSTQIRETQNSNTIKADQRDETLLLMQDCVQPTGKCFAQSKAQIAGAVAAIAKKNAVSAAAAAAASATCAAEHPGMKYEPLYRCTLRRVVAASDKP